MSTRGPKNNAYIAQATSTSTANTNSSHSLAEQPASSPGRIASGIKLLVFVLFGRWFVRYFELDRSIRQEPNTPYISTGWLTLALAALLPFVSVYLYASIWRRRIMGQPLDLQNWQANASSLIYSATLGLLVSWISATIALFPGYGVKSVVIVAVLAVCMVAIADALEAIFQ